MHIAVLCNGSTADSDSVCRGSNPFTAAKKKQVPTGTCFFFISFKRIRTCEGFGVWKMCRRHVFSRKREGGTAREAWRFLSGESARRSRRRRSSLLPLPKRSKCQPVLASFLFPFKRIRTCEGFGVWKMCRRHVFSRKREGGTAREAWRFLSGESARRSRRRRSSLLPLPKRKTRCFVSSFFCFVYKRIRASKVSAEVFCLPIFFWLKQRNGSSRAHSHRNNKIGYGLFL